MPVDSSHHGRLLELHEVAYELKCSVETVRRLIREGQLTAIRLRARCWRVDPIDLQAFKDALRVRGDAKQPAPARPAVIYQHPRGVSDAS
jgi:excisionase family DNA binding protein